ncbi:hypothetical protein Y1Q_0000637 [Alligator mississippiensis]|uniref:Uncharacterized protein n=1 Tax=Alligator mississippiensis TaxID=8496 RepID=A0A151MBY2_ALLMI|nr:hypothetical protein Y1Q_0000637 [Alligator mississippiensis]
MTLAATTSTSSSPGEVPGQVPAHCTPRAKDTRHRTPDAINDGQDHAEMPTSPAPNMWRKVGQGRGAALGVAHCIRRVAEEAGATRGDHPRPLGHGFEKV